MCEMCINGDIETFGDVNGPWKINVSLGKILAGMRNVVALGPAPVPSDSLHRANEIAQSTLDEHEDGNNDRKRKHISSRQRSQSDTSWSTYSVLANCPSTTECASLPFRPRGSWGMLPFMAASSYKAHFC
jgi:hypothetical protein